jgi:hypothetical protein
MAEAERALRRAVKRSRCAIYTRKSSEEGLDQDFNSPSARPVRLSSSRRSTKVGRFCRHRMTTAGTPVAPWSGPRCSG